LFVSVWVAGRGEREAQGPEAEQEQEREEARARRHIVREKTPGRSLANAKEIKLMDTCS